jgi:TRAP-type mannitol/chloroaromatic compound transport system permease large subunit
VFFLVMGGLFLGWFTPNEAGGVGAFGVLAVAMARGRMTWRGFTKSLYERFARHAWLCCWWPERSYSGIFWP